MRCRDVAALASDFANGDVPWRRRMAIQAHLMMCEACQRYVRQIRQVVALIRRPRPSESSGDADARALFRAIRAAR